MKMYVSEKNTMNIYDFMKLCGLECNFKENIKLSHKAMMKKLQLRKKSFRNIDIPVRIPFSRFKDEDVLRGRIIFVKDDYKTLIAYLRPNIMSNYAYEQHNNYSNEDNSSEKIEDDLTIKPGYLKYLLKKAKRQLEEEKKYIENEQKENKEDEYEMKLQCKNRIKRYNRHGFGRR